MSRLHFHRTINRTTGAAVLALLIAVGFAQIGGEAQTIDALPYTTGYLITGDYAVGSLDLHAADNIGNALSVGTMHISGVPAGADILAAFLYWETIDAPSLDASHIADTVQFRGQPIKSVRVKATTKPLTGSTAQCFASGSGSPLSITMFRADVVRLLPRLLDKDGVPTGKLLVNDADLQANNLPLTTVRLPENGNGNVTPDTAGASLVIVYRDTSLPLRKVVLYDGIHMAAQGEVLTQTLRGFYKTPAVKSAKLTYIAGSGAANTTETLWVNGASVATNPFPDSSRSSDRSWSHYTKDVSAQMAANTWSADFGETATARITHGSNTPYECLTLAATIFSSTVLDNDGDGIPDAVESGAPLKDPNGVVLPDLYGMGARPNHKDLFVEVNAMRTLSDTTYGSVNAPYDPDATPPVLGGIVAPPHNHMPPPDVIQTVGDAFKAAPIQNLDGSFGVRVHFDVGNPASYHALGADYAGSAGVNDEYLVSSTFARGGELDPETACNPTDPSCYFPDYPGTIGWGFALQRYMLPRFDKNRYGLFHYVLYAHSRGKPRSLPCLDAHGTPTLWSDVANHICGSPVNPLFEPNQLHVPTSSSGAGDLPGFRAIVTLGRWENFVGDALVRASTTMHEIGHQLGLWHGGAPAQLLNTQLGLVKQVEPNCKPTYLSIMSYMYQIGGLTDLNGVRQINYSAFANLAQNEATLSDQSVLPPNTLPNVLPYRPSWYAPLGNTPPTLVDTTGAPKALKLCNGAPLPAGANYARYDSDSVSPSIDWKTNGFVQNEGDAGQDINFDNIVNTSLTGYNDWANIRLNVLGSGLVMGGAISNGGSDFGGSDFGGSDFGGSDFGGSDFGGSDFGGSDFGGSDFGGSDFGGSDFGGLDIDGSDFGGSDFGGSDFGGRGFSGDGELDRVVAKAIIGSDGLPPATFSACVLGGDQPGPNYPRSVGGTQVGTPACVGATSPLHRVRLSWKAPSFGTPVLYRVFRVTGPLTGGSTPIEVCPGGTCGTTGLSMIDDEVLPDGRVFTYYAKAVFASGPPSGKSNTAAVLARNDAPIAIADARTTNEDTPLTATLANGGQVPINDSDPDSPALIPSLVSATTNGALSFNATDGTFTYSPNANFYGTDTFTYKLLGGTWPRDASVPLSADSIIVTVTIIVRPVNDVPSFAKGADVLVAEDSGLKTVNNWATAISAGPANETNGACAPAGSVVCNQVVDFIVTNNNTALFSAQPAVSPTGVLTFTPAADANGTATVTVRIHDNGGTADGGVDTSAPQSFTIKVWEVNDPPVANGDTVTTLEDTAVSFAAASLTTNDSNGPANESGQTLTVLSVAPTADTHGTVTLIGGTITYTPAPNFNGTAGFDYTITDDGTTNGSPDPRTANGHVTVNVTPVNDNPVAADDTAFTAKNTAVTIPVLANDTDVDGDTLSVQSTTTPAHGAAAISGGGTTVTYTPGTGFVGTDGFDYTVSDGNGGTDTKHVTVRVGNQALAVSRPAAGTTAASVLVLDLDNGVIASTLGVTDDFTDVAVTPDHNTALVTSFNQLSGTPNVTFIDLTTTPPSVLGSLTLPMFAEDVDISPDGKFAVITDGSASSSVVSVNIATRQIVTTLTLPFLAEGATFVPNSSIVLVNGQDAGVVRVLTIAADGSLTDTGAQVTVTTPLNVQPSPDGAIALVAGGFSSSGITLVNISTGGVVTSGGLVTPASGETLGDAQSIAFTPDGAHAYALLATNQVAVLDITAGHIVADSGVRIAIAGASTPLYFGVDEIAATGDGRYIVAHLAGAVSVIDPTTNTVVRTITLTSDAGVGGIAAIW